MNKTSNGIPYGEVDRNTVTLFPSKESHKLADVNTAKKEMKAEGLKTFITWTRTLKPMVTT